MRMQFSVVLSAFSVAAALALAGTAWLAAAPRAEAVSVRIASWNILNGLDTSSNAAEASDTREDDYWQVVDSIRRVGPDIVGFAELNSDDATMLPELAALLDYPYYALSAEKMNTGSYRQGVISRWPITSASLVKENTVDPEAAEIKRWPIHAVIEVPGALNPLHVFVVHTHPGTTGKANRLWRAMNAWRMRQYLAAMNAELPEDTEYVIMGDFNENSTGDTGAGQHASFDYAYYTNRLAAGTLFGDWFHLGSDFPWSTNTDFVLPYKLYPDERFLDLQPMTNTYRTGMEAEHDGATYPSTAHKLDYIMFSDEIRASAYGAPQCEVYWASNDVENGSAGLPKPGPWLPTLATNSALTVAKKGLDHLMVFGDFNMIDAVAGLTPVAIISEVVNCAGTNTANYVEIANTGSAALDVEGYVVEVYCDGATTPTYSRTLAGSIEARSAYWIAAYSAGSSNVWRSVWDHAPDDTTSYFKNFDGDDTVVLRNAAGTILDIYGAIGVDGTGKAWEYANAAAVRNPGVSEPATTWAPSEWTITLPCTAAATPGAHVAVSDADVLLTGVALSPPAPQATNAFQIEAVATPNALASNLSLRLWFSLNGATWDTNVVFANIAGTTTWRTPPLDVARAPGDRLAFLAEATFEGPGGLSPVYSAQQDYVFPGMTNATGRLDAVLFNEISLASSGYFVELAGDVGHSLAGHSLAYYNGAADADGPCWTFVFPDDAAIPPGDGATDEWGNPVGFLVLAESDDGETTAVANADLLLTNKYSATASHLLGAGPAALILYGPPNASGATSVLDAVLWLSASADAADTAVDDPGNVYTNIAQGSPDYLHEIGVRPYASNSKQAPNWILAGRDTDALVATNDWRGATPTPGALNARQTSGALRLARVDRDGDSLLDDEDNCPSATNPTQADIDGDGVGDECDPDKDGDGIPNDIDNCPSEYNPMQLDSDGDGIGDECDPDCDPEAIDTSIETVWVTFETITAANYRGVTFTENDRTWTLAEAGSFADAADHKIANHAMRTRTNGTLTLEGILTNGLSGLSFFYAPYGTDANTPDILVETAPTNTDDWAEIARVPTSNATNLVRASIAGLAVTDPVRFRLRTDGGDNTRHVNIDNLLVTCTILVDPDVDLDSPLVVAYDGLAHTNSFTVAPERANWTVTYRDTNNAVVNLPVDVGEYTAVVTVFGENNIRAATFTFPASVIVKSVIRDPEVSPVESIAYHSSALLEATVNPWTDDGEAIPVIFEYGPSASFGNKVLSDESPVSGTNALSVFATLDGLSPQTLYYWRVHVGDVVSGTLTFTTDEIPVPTVEISAIGTNEFLASWAPIAGATNYVLQVHTLDAGGGSRTITEDFSDWTARDLTLTNVVQTTTNGDWTYHGIAAIPNAAAKGSGSKGALDLYYYSRQNYWYNAYTNGTLTFPAFDGIESIALQACRGAGNSSASLVLQLSQDGGATFADVTTFTLSSSSPSAKTYAWPTALPAGAILRLRNTSTRSIARLYDLTATLADETSVDIPGYPANLLPTEALGGFEDIVVDGLERVTTYHVTLKAQGDGWETEWSPDVSATTLDNGQTPALSPWTATPVVAIGETLVRNISATGDPVPVLALASSTAAGPCSLGDATTNTLTVTAPFTYVPAPADLGTNDFHLTAANAGGVGTATYHVAVVARAPVLNALLQTSAGSLLATWSPVTAAAAYRVQLATTPDFSAGGSGDAQPPDHVDFEGTIDYPAGWTGTATINTNKATHSSLDGVQSGTAVAVFNSASDYVRTPVLALPATIAYAYKKTASNTNECPLVVSVATTTFPDHWMPIATNSLTAAGDGDIHRHTLDLSAYSDIYVKFADTREDRSAERYLDDITITYRADTSASTILADAYVNSTNYAPADLSTNVPYYLRAQTIYAGDVASDWSAVRALTLTNAAPSAADLYRAWIAAALPDAPAGDASLDASADPDADGQTNWQEFLADTSPTNAASVLELVPVTLDEAGNLLFTFPASTARYYQLLYQTNLLEPFATNPLGWGPATTNPLFTNPLPDTSPALFLRLRALLDAPAE